MHKYLSTDFFFPDRGVITGSKNINILRLLLYTQIVLHKDYTMFSLMSDFLKTIHHWVLAFKNLSLNLAG